MMNTTSIIKEGKLIAKELIAFISLLYVTNEYGISGTSCVGPSMMPTLRSDGDFVLYNAFNYKVLGNSYKKGDVVICTCPYDPSKNICKRVAGVGGDELIVQDDYSRYGTSVSVPPGHVWLLGDNANNSLDSRRYGAVPIDLIKGRCFSKISLFQFPFFLPINDLASADTV